MSILFSPRGQALLATAAMLLLALLPSLTSSNYIISVAISGLLMTVAAASLNLVYGYAGLLSFAQLGFWGVGAYASAIVVKDHGGSFWLGVLASALVSGVLALLIGLPLLRTRRHAFVVATLTFALLCTLVSRDWIDLTHGPMGIPGLPPPEAFGFVFEGSRRFLFIALGFSVLALGFLHLLGTSRIGLVLKAIRQNEPLVQSQGISPLPYKLAAFAVAAVITGAAGGIFAFHLRVVDPLIFDFYYMQTFLIIVIIGGAGSFWGVVLAGAAMVALPEMLRFSNDLRMVIYGAILVAAMLYMPRGVTGWLEDRRIAILRAMLS
ncbi:branched-chain amino acid ABC transporter permease [Roseomonas sp. BN140053]|uniref:branched-chain amino acid ABC transporter permease n=1 Tax=Roseomonas sp. BN140053 TaxID=3391898 RepID=UPI0039EAFA31